MDSPGYTPSEHLTPAKGAYSPDYASSEFITPMKSSGPFEYHCPTPPNSKPRIKVASGNLRINTRTTMPKEMWEGGPQRTITKSGGSMSVQEHRDLEADSMSIDAYNNAQQEVVDCVRIWKAHVESISVPELIVAMNPFYDECVDGNYYNWLNDKYYEGHMPEIVRRANAFRDFPQLDEERFNPQEWEQKHAYYRSPKGVRDMEPYQDFIDREQGLLEPQLCEYDILAEEEAEREGKEAFQKAWVNTFGQAGEPTSVTLRANSTEPSTAIPKVLPTNSSMFSSKGPASPTVQTESTSPGPAARPVFTAAKAEGWCRIRIKSGPMVESAAGHTAGSSSKTHKKKKKEKKKKKKMPPQ